MIKPRRLKSLFPTAAELRAEKLSLALCAVSGLFGGLIFQMNGLGTFAWFALIPYFIAVLRLHGKMLFWGTMLFGAIWNYLSIWWLYTLTIFNPFIPIGIILVALIHALYFLWFALPASWLARRIPTWLLPPVLAVLWTGMEYIRTFSDFAFPWNYLAHSQVGTPTVGIIQWASGTGTYGPSFLIALFNAAVVMLIVQSGDSVKRIARIINRSAIASAYGMLCIAAVLTGDLLRHYLSTFDNVDGVYKPPVSIAVVQPNVSQTDKWVSYSASTPEDHKRAAGILRETLRLTLEAGAKSPKLIILPETAFPAVGFVYDLRLHEILQQFAREAGADIFFGADSRMSKQEYLERLRAGFRPPSPDRRPTTYTLPRLALRHDERGTTVPYEPYEMVALNSAFQVKPDKGILDYVYSKVQLVPFGETAPLVDMIPYFQEKIMMVGSFQRGFEFTVFETDGFKYSPLICFESAFASLARGAAKSGAQCIVVLTNDAWYDPGYLIEAGGFWGALLRTPGLHTLASCGPRQHFVQSVFRAIETRLPVIRAANTGISAVISPEGKILKKAEFGEQAILLHNLVVPTANPTFYTRYGDWFAQICFTFLILTLLAMGINGFQRRSRRSTLGTRTMDA